jgi:hypothetical protein
VTYLSRNLHISSRDAVGSSPYQMAAGESPRSVNQT